MGERCHEHVLDHKNICERRCRRRAKPGTLYCHQHTIKTRAELVTEAWEQGAAEERARIVAWLESEARRIRGSASVFSSHYNETTDRANALQAAADAIGAGEHKPEQDGETP